MVELVVVLFLGGMVDRLVAGVVVVVVVGEVIGAGAGAVLLL